MLELPSTESLASVDRVNSQPDADHVGMSLPLQFTERTVTAAPWQSVVHRGGPTVDPRAVYFFVVQP